MSDSKVVLDATPEPVMIKSGLQVTDPEGCGVYIDSMGGGDVRIRASAGGSWQGPLQVLETPDGVELASFSSLGVSFYGTPASPQSERVGQLASDASLAEVVAKVNALELVLHKLGLTK